MSLTRRLAVLILITTILLIGCQEKKGTTITYDDKAPSDRIITINNLNETDEQGRTVLFTVYEEKIVGIFYYKGGEIYFEGDAEKTKNIILNAYN